MKRFVWASYGSIRRFVTFFEGFLLFGVIQRPFASVGKMLGRVRGKIGVTAISAAGMVLIVFRKPLGVGYCFEYDSFLTLSDKD